MYAYAFLDEFVLIYPVYTLLFADTGLSAAGISSLFVIWSVTAFVLEVPSGAWADTFSRRRLLTIAPVLAAAAYALWTFLPSYPSFALGFVLWGAADALRSGTLEALVYEELVRIGARDAYERLIGRSRTVGTVAVLAATAAAAPLLAEGGYRTVGAVSVVVALLAVPVARSLPESRGPAGPRESYSAVLRGGLAEVRHSSAVRRALVPVAAVVGLTALDEYLPLLARATGAAAADVPLLMLLTTAGMAVGGLLAGRGTRWLAPLLALGAGCLAAGAVSGHPAGLVPVAVAFGVFEWASVTADARLQERLTDRTRATITSVAGFGTEVVAVAVFASYALGSRWAGPGPLLALAAVPYLVLAVALRRSGPAGGEREPPEG